MSKFVLVVTLLLTGSATSVDRVRIETAVRDAYPQRLAALADEHRNLAGQLPKRRAVSEVLSSAGNRAIVFAAYSDDELGAVQVLEVGTSIRIIATYDPLLDAGPGEPRIELRDVDADGRDEIFVVLPHIRRPFALTYVFRFADGKLTLMSPTVCRSQDPGYVTTDMLFVEPVDLDGDKTLELLDRREQRIDHLSNVEEEALIDLIRIWKLDGGRYQQRGEAVYFERFVRRSDAPEAVPQEFYARPGPADLLVVNGAGAEARVSSASITVNGAELVREKDLNQTVGQLAVPIDLKEANTLTVRVGGKPESTLTVYVVPRRARADSPCD